MTELGTRSAPPVVDPLFEVTDDADEVVHLVCCRDVSWRRALCGEPGDRLALEPRHVCSMCVEEAKRLQPGWTLLQEQYRCPVDGRLCPSEAEIDEEIARRSRP